MRAVVVLPTPRTPVGCRPAGCARCGTRWSGCAPRLLADQVVEAVRPVFARQHPVGLPAAAPQVPPGTSVVGCRVPSVIDRSAMIVSRSRLRNGNRSAQNGEACLARFARKTGRRRTSDPLRNSLGLLPSGPDPVGEWLVRRQFPGPYSGPKSHGRQAGGRMRDCRMAKGHRIASMTDHARIHVFPSTQRLDVDGRTTRP